MEHRTASTTSVATIPDLAKTLRYRREEITTKFTREPVDADDTVPVELYSRPYERIDIQAASSPYERIEIEIEISANSSLAADVPGDLVHSAPSSSLRLLLAVSILCLTFALGVGFAFLVL